MSATGEQQSTVGVKKRKALMEKVDGARLAENDVLQMEIIAPVKLLVRDLKLTQKVVSSPIFLIGQNGEPPKCELRKKNPQEMKSFPGGPHMSCFSLPFWVTFSVSLMLSSYYFLCSKALLHI